MDVNRHSTQTPIGELSIRNQLDQIGAPTTWKNIFDQKFLYAAETDQPFAAVRDLYALSSPVD